MIKRKAAVIGAGISGLCVAYRLQKTGVDVTVFESSSRVGGNIQTELRDGFTIEYGPNSLLANRELLELIDDLQLTDQVLRPFPAAKNRYILRDGKPIVLPGSLLGMVSTAAFSTRGKIRMLKEPFVRSSSVDGESVAAFFERRLGKEIVDYAVDPFISGIYAGDPNKLSIRYSFPRLYEMERAFGSLFKAAIFDQNAKANRLPKDAPRTLTFRSGMQTLTDALREKLADLRLNTPIDSIVKTDSGYVVNGEAFDAIVLSVPAHAAARVIEELDRSLAAKLSSIFYPPIAVVYSAYKAKQVGFTPDGFGMLIPSVEKRRILGTLWNSSVFAERAPVGYHLFTTFIGGARNASLCEMSESELIAIAHNELVSIMNIAGGPEFTAIKIHGRSIPQYNIDYETVANAIEDFERANPGFVFCSNFYKGISVGDCIKNSVAATAKLLTFNY